MPDYPWITYSARKELDKIVRPSHICFEWGSGGSTLYFSQRAKSLVSVEHDPVWYKKVASELKSRQVANCDYHFVPPENFYLGALFNRIEGGYKSTDKGLAKKIFYQYCRQISYFGNNYFDLVFVDGRARVSCLILCVNKIKPGGWLIFDNSEREEYEAGISQLKGWKRLDFFGHGPYSKAKWQTTFFQKP